MRSGRERYKREQKRTKRNINIKFGNILFFLALIAVVGYGIYTYIGFSKIKSEDPIKKSNSDYYLLSNERDALEKTLIIFEEEYNGKDRIKVAYLYAENKEKGVGVLVYIPGWVEYTGLEKDFGSSIPISTFRYAGDFLQKGRGFEYAIWQFEQLLGSNIDEYIWVSSSAYKVFSEKLGESGGDSVYAQYYSNGFKVNQEAFMLNSFVSKLGWLNLILSSPRFKGSEAVIYSSLPTLGNVVMRLKQIHESSISIRPYLLDLSSSEYLSQQESLGGVGISSYIDTEKYDAVWRNFIDGMIDRELEKERVRVEVYNGSGMSGYASQYARKIRNSGCEVVRYDNAPDIQDKTQFYVPKRDDFKKSLSVIFELFPGTYETVQGRPSFMTTGDIVIILGKDIPTMYAF